MSGSNQRWLVHTKRSSWWFSPKFSCFLSCRLPIRHKLFSYFLRFFAFFLSGWHLFPTHFIAAWFFGVGFVWFVFIFIDVRFVVSPFLWSMAVVVVVVSGVGWWAVPWQCFRWNRTTRCVHGQFYAGRVCCLSCGTQCALLSHVGTLSNILAPSFCQ